MLKRFFLISSIVVLVVAIFYFLNLYLKRSIKNTDLYGKAVTSMSVKKISFRKIERDKEVWKRNPFNHKKENREKLFRTPLDKEINLDIGAIVTGEKNYAIVNGKIIKAGDKIDGYKVVTIQKHKIIFDKNGIRKEVYIY